MLVTSLSLTAEFISSNTSSSAFVYGTMSYFLTNCRLDLDVFCSVFQKIPNPVVNLSKNLVVSLKNADKKSLELMNLAVKERLVTSIVIPSIPEITLSNF